MKKLLITTIFVIQAFVCFAPGFKTVYLVMPEVVKKEYTLTEKLQAILNVESSNGVNTYNPGETEAVGILQIHPIMVMECNRILGYEKYQLSDRLSDKMSVEMFFVYQSRYNPTMDFQIMARNWCGGPKGMNKTSTLKYYELAKHQLLSA